MEREIRSLSVRFSGAQFVALCRCIIDDFNAWYDGCQEDPYGDHTEALDRMEEDLDLLQATLPAISSEETEFEIRKTIADFNSKIAEVA